MLYIMRHGKTEWNEKNKLQGRTDIPLNAEGKTMAKQAGKEYREVHLDICYSSPLLRAKETAEILLHGREVPLVIDDRLMEMSFGVCEGTENYFHTVESPIGVLFQHPESYTCVQNGESLADLFTRTGEFLREVVQPLLEQKKDILIVGHGAMNCSIICQVRHIPIKDFWSAGIENCKLIRLI